MKKMASPLMRADRSNVSVPSGGMLMDAAQHPPKGPAAHPPLPDRKSGTMMQSKRTGSTRVVVLAPTREVHPVPQAYRISTMRSALVRSISQWNPFLRLGCSSLAGRSTLPVTVHAQRASSYLSTTPSLERREASPPPPRLFSRVRQELTVMPSTALRRASHLARVDISQVWYPRRTRPARTGARMGLLVPVECRAM